MISEKISLGINGNIKIPGDKSISHRSIIIPSISKGICEISNLLKSEDVLHTLNAFKSLGVKIEEQNDKTIVYGRGLNSLKKSSKELFLGNSGTSARLLTGLLSSYPFISVLKGDKSLSSRPMNRIIDPLIKMNGEFKSTNGSLPLKIIGKELNNFNHEILIPSAQVKSGIILACLNTEGKSTIIENHVTRNHTEIMLQSFDANIDIKKNISSSKIIINGKNELKSKNIEVPSDLSSSAFFIVAALINTDSKIRLKNINLNPTRDGILKALKIMGANIAFTNKKIINNEYVADILVESSNLKGCELDESMAKLMIDEYPILSIAASFANSPSVFKGLQELKVKESNRLELIKINLNKCGIFCEINNNDLFIDPTKKNSIKDNNIKTDFDHRIAMSFAVMGSKLGNLKIEDSESINTSFPKFKEIYNSSGGNLIEK
tara:strand:- start:7474 stop:8778 length:1305 start_codon:yes stop_codon:yes gene_type:complete